MKKFIYILIIFGFFNSISAQSLPCGDVTIVSIDTINTVTPNQPHINTPPLDSDGDGLSDEFEGTDDWDQDGLPNYLDLDSDGDGVGDVIDMCYFEFGVPPTGCPGPVTDRHVFWVHGYKGTGHSWALPPQPDGNKWEDGGVGGYVSHTYQVKSDYPDYSENMNEVQAAANRVKNDIMEVVGNNLTAPNNFIIAHSGGGVVSRQMGQFNNNAGVKAFNGFITFGTPHQGCAAASNYLNHPWKFENAVKVACKALTAGPIGDPSDNTFVVGALNIANLMVGNIGEIVANLGCNLIIPEVFPLVEDYLIGGIEGQLTTEYAQSSLPPMATEHNAAFYAIETDNDITNDDYDESMTPRFLGSGLYSPNSFPLWGAGASDELGMRDVHDATSFYLNKKQEWRTKWENCFIYNCTSRYNNYLNYKKGVDWWKNLNNTWKDLIGAVGVEFKKDGCGCDVYVNGEVISSEFFPGNNDCEAYEYNYGNTWIVCSDTYTTTIYSKPSDGFILAESAMNAPGVNYEVRFMPGSSHFQMRNDENTRDAVRAIFYEGLGGKFFKTDKR